MNELFNEIADCIIDAQQSEVEKLVDKALEKGYSAKDIINDALLVGMNEVGDLFKDGDMFVPEVLISAKSMNIGMTKLKPMLKEGDVKKAGKVVFATVKGDLHDIGKKLVEMMLEGSGYEIIDLGVDVAADTIVEAVREHKPDILGMSAMLTTTMGSMKDTIKALEDTNLYDNLNIIIGGAPVNEKYAQKIGAHYSGDASEAVELANKLMNN